MNCVVCSASTRDVFLCRNCLAEIEQAVAETPALLTELDVTITRQDRTVTGNATKRTGNATPLPFGWNAADVRWVLVNTVSTWARHLAETRGVPGWHGERRNPVPPSPDAPSVTPSAQGEAGAVAEVVGFLLANLGSFALDEAAQQAHDELTAAWRNATQAIDRPADPEFVGRCDATDVRTALDGDTVRATVIACSAPLYVRQGQGRVTCGTCGADYDVTERRERIRERLPEVLATAVEISRALRRLDGTAVGVDAIRKMASRGEIANRGWRGREALYLAGDVMQVLARRAYPTRRATGACA